MAFILYKLEDQLDGEVGSCLSCLEVSGQANGQNGLCCVVAKMARLVAVGDTARLQYEWNLSKNGNSFRGCICTMTRLDKICFSFTLFF